VVPFAAQPAEKGAFQQPGVETIGLRPAMLARDNDAGRMDDMGLNTVRPQPGGQPEAVAARLESNRDPGDRPPGLGSLVAPA
jgi:hypothetical protein